MKGLFGLTQLSARRQWLSLAGGLCLVYAGLAVFYTTPALSSSRFAKELLVWPVTALLLAGYWKGYRVLHRTNIPTAWIFALGILMALLAVLVPPFHSTDIWGYINRGWQQAHYGLNPYVHTIAQIPGWEQDPMITDHWVNNPSPYGFLYLLMAKALCLLGGGNKALTLFYFKASNLVIHLLIGGLVWLGARRCQRDNPDFHPERSLYLYLWNPLLLLHSVANGHNDLWMGLFLLLSAYVALLGGGAWVWMLPALAAATLIKYGAVVVIPLACLFLLRQKAWKALGVGSLLALGILVLCALPYWSEWRDFHLKEIGRNAFVSHGSLHSLIYSAYKTLAKVVLPGLHDTQELVRTVLKNTLLGSFAIFYGMLAFRRFRAASYPASLWVSDALLVMALLICLVSLKFYPWYLGMFFPLALYLQEGHWLRRSTVALSGAQLLSITFIGQAHFLNFLAMTGLPIVTVALPALGLSKRTIAIGSVAIILLLLALALLVGGFASTIFPSHTTPLSNVSSHWMPALFQWTVGTAS